MNLKSLYKKYTNYIVIALLILFCFKSCQLGMNRRSNQYTSNQYEMKIDSLYDSINYLHNELVYWQDSLEDANKEIQYLLDKNKDLRGSNSYLRITTSNLIKNNENLINK